jgi:predicted lipoprotein with Yx(FWY)xxD motif
VSRHPSMLAAVTLAVAGLAVAGCGSSSKTTGSASSGGGYASSSAASTKSSSASKTTAAASGGSASGGTVVGVTHTSLGTILTAGPKKLTVYLFVADKGSTSTCNGECAQVWPPVITTGAPQAQEGAQSADLGTTTRSDGTKQVTYKGHPLYYYVSDQSSGDTTGQGVNSFGAPWYVLTPQGEKVEGS